MLAPVGTGGEPKPNCSATNAAMGSFCGNAAMGSFCRNPAVGLFCHNAPVGSFCGNAIWSIAISRIVSDRSHAMRSPHGRSRPPKAPVAAYVLHSEYAPYFTMFLLCSQRFRGIMHLP